MPFLFSYGSLQQEDVQLSTFGRLLQGKRDELPGYEAALVKIEDPQITSTIGRSHYDNAKYNGRSESVVNGTVFEITDAELTAADKYEEIASYKRIAVTLVSGMRAWVYVDSRTAPASFEPR